MRGGIALPIAGGLNAAFQGALLGAQIVRSAAPIFIFLHCALIAYAVWLVIQARD